MNETQQYFLRAVSCALKTTAIEAPADSIDWKKLLACTRTDAHSGAVRHAAERAFGPGAEPVAHAILAGCGAADPAYQDLPENVSGAYPAGLSASDRQGAALPSDLSRAGCPRVFG